MAFVSAEAGVQLRAVLKDSMGTTTATNSAFLGASIPDISPWGWGSVELMPLNGMLSSEIAGEATVTLQFRNTDVEGSADMYDADGVPGRYSGLLYGAVTVTQTYDGESASFDVDFDEFLIGATISGATTLVDIENTLTLGVCPASDVWLPPFQWLSISDVWLQTFEPLSMIAGHWCPQEGWFEVGEGLEGEEGRDIRYTYDNGEVLIDTNEDLVPEITIPSCLHALTCPQ